MSDGQLEGQTDGAAAVSLVAGFPATTQAVTQVQVLPLNTNIFLTSACNLRFVLILYGLIKQFFVFLSLSILKP